MTCLPGLIKWYKSGLPRNDRSLSEIVNEAVRLSLAEDAEDLAAFKERAREPNLAFEDVLKDLKRSGTI